jgi:hypothetical protein
MSILSSASLVVLCLFYIYSASTFFGIRIYPLINRVTYYTQFESYIVNAYVDHLILGLLLLLWAIVSLRNSKGRYIAILALSVFFAASVLLNYSPALIGMALGSLPAISALLLYNRYSPRKILDNLFSELTLNYFAILGIILATIAAALIFVHVSHSSFLTGVSVRNYAYDVFLALSSFSPFFILLLITCIPVKLFSDAANRLMKIKWQFDSLPSVAIDKKRKTVYLSLILFLSLVVVFIPHLPIINPDARSIGVDTGYYVNWNRVLSNSTSVNDLFYHAFVTQDQGHRPLSLLFIYSLESITNLDPATVVEYLPLILGPALIIAVYFLARELTSNDHVALLSGFITAVSSQVLIGIYAAFYANWMALILGYLSLVFMFRFLKKGEIRNLATYGLLTLMMLLTHVYTWSILSMVMGTFLLVSVVSRSTTMFRTASRKNAILLLLILLSTVAVDIERSVSTGASGGIERDLQLADSLVGFEQLTQRWNNLTYTTVTFVGGLFANFIVLGLGLYWLVRTSTRDYTSIFLMIFLSIGILPFLFGEWVIQTRVFYNIPFQIPAAIALFQIKNQTTGRIKVAPIYFWLVVVAIIAVSNFYLVAPQS